MGLGFFLVSGGVSSRFKGRESGSCWDKDLMEDGGG